MKKIVTLFAALFAAVSFADTETVDGVEYTFSILDGKATIGTGSLSAAIPMSTSGAIVIPSTLGGCPVTTIGEGAFYGCSSLTSVTIPEGVTTIGVTAFFDCRSLQGIVVGVANASYCSIDGVLYTKDVRTLVACPGAKTSVTIPSSVTTIGDFAFYSCGSLTSVTIPEGVTTIGSGAFFCCGSLTELKIPSSVTRIGEGAFSGTSLGDYFLFNYSTQDGFIILGKVLYQGPNDPLYIGDITIPDGVTMIMAEVFTPTPTLQDTNTDVIFFNNNITSVTIPESVRIIGARAFQNCAQLETVTILSKNPQIGMRAFDGTPWLDKKIIGMALNEGAGGASNTVTVKQEVTHYVLNSVQPSFVLPAAYDTGFVNVIAEVKGGCVAIPATWTVNYPKFTEKFGSDFTKALSMKSGKLAAGGREMLVWEDYVAGTDPTDPNDKFTASMTLVDGKPVISWIPELDPERAAMRKYTTYGKVKLTDSEWIVVPEGRASDYNFFKVTVEMK